MGRMCGGQAPPDGPPTGVGPAVTDRAAGIGFVRRRPASGPIASSRCRLTSTHGGPRLACSSDGTGWRAS
jgi:hypothetical protein